MLHVVKTVIYAVFHADYTNIGSSVFITQAILCHSCQCTVMCRCVYVFMYILRVMPLSIRANTLYRPEIGFCT